VIAVAPRRHTLWTVGARCDVGFLSCQQAIAPDEADLAFFDDRDNAESDSLTQAECIATALSFQPVSAYGIENKRASSTENA
jgi:hypothetical protein